MTFLLNSSYIGCLYQSETFFNYETISSKKLKMLLKYYCIKQKYLQIHCLFDVQLMQKSTYVWLYNFCIRKKGHLTEC